MENFEVFHCVLHHFMVGHNYLCCTSHVALLNNFVSTSLSIYKISREVPHAQIYCPCCSSAGYPSISQFAEMQTIKNNWIKGTSKNFVKKQISACQGHPTISMNFVIDTLDKSVMMLLGQWFLFVLRRIIGLTYETC